MKKLIKRVRRMVIRWHVKSLNAQAQHIIEARSAALARLLEIQRKREHVRRQLWA